MSRVAVIYSPRHAASGLGIRRAMRLTREVLRAHLLEELPELLDLVFLLVRNHDPGLREDLVGAADRGAHTQGERDRVARPGRHPHAVTDQEIGVVYVLLQLGDLHRVQWRLQRRQNVPQKVMRKRPSWLDPLLLVRDRGGLYRADPDRQVTIAVDLFEQHDRL